MVRECSFLTHHSFPECDSSRSIDSISCKSLVGAVATPSVVVFHMSSTVRDHSTVALTCPGVYPWSLGRENRESRMVRGLQ